MPAQGSGNAVRIEGLDKLERDLKKLETGLDKELKAAGFEAAMVVARAAGPRVPVGDPNVDPHPGRLAASLRARATRKGGAVTAGGSAVPYAAPIHWGWARRGIPANKFLVHALDISRAAITEVYARRIESIKRRVFGHGIG